MRLRCPTVPHHLRLQRWCERPFLACFFSRFGPKKPTQRGVTHVRRNRGKEVWEKRGKEWEKGRDALFPSIFFLQCSPFFSLCSSTSRSAVAALFPRRRCCCRAAACGWSLAQTAMGHASSGRALMRVAVLVLVMTGVVSAQDGEWTWGTMVSRRCESDIVLFVRAGPVGCGAPRPATNAPLLLCHSHDNHSTSPAR